VDLNNNKICPWATKAILITNSHLAIVVLQHSTSHLISTIIFEEAFQGAIGEHHITN